MSYKMLLSFKSETISKRFVSSMRGALKIDYSFSKKKRDKKCI